LVDSCLYTGRRPPRAVLEPPELGRATAFLPSRTIPAMTMEGDEGQALVETRAIDAGDTLAAQVYDRLRDDIILALLRPGQKLTMDLLKERYGVGMTPLREALHRLSSSMLVTIENRRGFRVASISPAHLIEVISAREEVEVILLRA